MKTTVEISNNQKGEERDRVRQEKLQKRGHCQRKSRP